jgi:glycosyltransferase involved in cell wall biosynthesis
MRIALYTLTYKRDQDGVAKTLYELVRTIRDRGMEVGVWSPSVSPTGDSKVPVHKVSSFPLPLYPDYRVAAPLGKTVAQLDRFRPHVIHIATPDIGGKKFLDYAKKRGLGVLATYHTDFPSYLKYYHLSPLKELLWKYFRDFYNECDAVYAPTRKVAGSLERRGIRDVDLWPRGIHRERFHPRFRSRELRKRWGAEGKKAILFSGRFVWYKGLEIFVRVYGLFKGRRKDDVRFVLLGDGPVRGDLKTRMPDAVFTGYLKGEELSRAYASADILLFPSITETFGNVVLEALASGLPAVVSDIGGCQEVVKDSGGGCVARAEDPVMFFKHCVSLVEDLHLYQSLRENGLRYAEKQAWDSINETIIGKYLELFNSKSRAS